MNEEMIIHGKWDKFLTWEGERLLLATRRHPIVIVLPAFFVFVLAFIFSIGAFILFTRLLPSLPLFFATVLLLASVLITLITKFIVDWYFHVYILTTRKILEVWYTPLYSHVMNDVLLDRVSCTEIDFRRNGFMNELIDVGDVVLTFDRPTHEESFIFRDVRQCYKLGRFLTQKLLDHGSQSNLQPIWYRYHKTPQEG